MFTVDQLMAHAIGDYILQSDSMAREKRTSWFAVISHVCFYAFPFIVMCGPSLSALAVIVVTHALIDKYALAHYVIWLRNNFLSPGGAPLLSWNEVKDSYGMPSDRPAWLAGWLYIITDNIMHVSINALALRFL